MPALMFAAIVWVFGVLVGLVMEAFMTLGYAAMCVGAVVTASGQWVTAAITPRHSYA